MPTQQNPKQISDNRQGGWTKIITTVFNKDNSFAVTALSAIASATLCAIAYLYQRINLLMWQIPPETIRENENKSVVYYIIFGILFLTSTLVTQIALRYLLFTSVIKLKYRRILKRVIKACKRALKLQSDNSQKTYEQRFNKVQQKLGKMAKQSWFQIIIRCIIISSICLLPPYLILQLVIADKLSVTTMIVGAVLILLAGSTGALLQVNAILPTNLKTLVKQSERLDTNPKEHLLLLSKLSAVIDKQKQREAHQPANLPERMWGTVSRADLYSAVISIAISSILLVVLGAISASQKTDFWLYMENAHSTYAVVYFNGDKAVFKQVLIIDNTLYINLEQQKYESHEGKNLVHKKFNRVSKNPLPISSTYGIIKQNRTTKPSC